MISGVPRSALHQSNEWDFKDTPPPVTPSILQKHNFQPENVTTQCPTASFLCLKRHGKHL
ncbi:hypothetical protein F7725_012456 [Dissostichus mawsoni]|uniref:Uncharacterized protein n=1 Tax=Dissostichus mawsoni TaxID=36200 RepID=A0A7J5YMD9_DISMA|nr:hypothetical protein F7725_012456 [Dissostichus mawsoni]